MIGNDDTAPIDDKLILAIFDDTKSNDESSDPTTIDVNYG